MCVHTTHRTPQPRARARPCAATVVGDGPSAGRGGHVGSKAAPSSRVSPPSTRARRDAFCRCRPSNGASCRHSPPLPPTHVHRTPARAPLTCSQSPQPSHVSCAPSRDDYTPVSSSVCSLFQRIFYFNGRLDLARGSSSSVNRCRRGQQRTTGLPLAAPDSGGLPCPTSAAAPWIRGPRGLLCRRTREIHVVRPVCGVIRTAPTARLAWQFEPTALAPRWR